MARPEFFSGLHDRRETVLALLTAVRELVAADRDMRKALSGRMALTENDVRAVRYVIAAARAERPGTPREIAAHLGMTTAATTVLLDRLVAAGHVLRSPHPTDRRSKTVMPTERAYEEVRQLLTPAHDGMRAVAARVPADAVPAVLAFLAELTAAMRTETSRL